MGSRFCFITACNNESVLQSSLLASPDLAGGVEIHVQRRASSAARAYNAALDASQGEVLIFLHQDIYLPPGWLDRLAGILTLVSSSDPHWGVLGVFGTSKDGIGRGVVHSTGMNQTFGAPFQGIKEVETLDEVMLITRRSSGLRFDEGLEGFHLYGADFCLQARLRGMRSYAAALFCIHNSSGLRILPRDYWKCYLYMRKKWWRDLPVVTPCMPITRSGGVALLYLLKTPLRLALRPPKLGGRVANPRQLFETLSHVPNYGTSE